MKKQPKKVSPPFFRLAQESRDKSTLVSSAVKAGFPSPAEGDSEEELDLNRYLIKHPAATFFVRVEGDSMSHGNILNGDLLIVDRALDPKNGSIVVALLSGEFTVKKLSFKKGKLFLEPENPSFPSLEVQEEMEFSVWGVVTYVIHKTT